MLAKAHDARSHNMRRHNRDKSQREGHIQIRIRGTRERDENFFARFFLVKSYTAQTRQNPKPVGSQDKNKKRKKDREKLFRAMPVGGNKINKGNRLFVYNLYYILQSARN